MNADQHLDADTLYEVTGTVQLPEGEHKVVAVYRGNPWRDPNAELVAGEDIAHRGMRWAQKVTDAAPTSLDPDRVIHVRSVT